MAKSDEAGIFSPCRTGKRYTTRDATPSREAAALYEEITPRVGRPVFIEFAGVQESEDHIVIERVLRAAASGPACAESGQAFEVRAFGTSPTWRLDLAPETLLFQRAATPASRWPYQAFSRADGRRELAADGEAGSINVTITPGRCVDELARGVFSLRAEVQFEGRTYQGCAYEGRLSSK